MSKVCILFLPVRIYEYNMYNVFLWVLNLFFYFKCVNESNVT